MVRGRKESYSPTCLLIATTIDAMVKQASDTRYTNWKIFNPQPMPKSFAYLPSLDFTDCAPR